MIIKKLLDYKFQSVKWLVHVLFIMQLSYLCCVLIFPLYPNLDDKVMVGIYLSIFVTREVLQFRTLYI
jgi:hypothetical protein